MMARILAKAAVGGLLVALMIGGCSRPTLAKSLTVYHVGFNVDTITGYHEDDFPEAGCKGEINEDVFLTLIGPIKHHFDYRYNDVKSLVISKTGRPYYIDYYGNVRHGDDFYQINKDKFEKSINYIGKC